MFSNRSLGKCLCKSLLAALLLLALFAGCQEDSGPEQSKTPPDGGPLANIQTQETFNFVVIGDTRTGIAVFKQHIKEINLLDPDFVIDSGDLINGYATELRNIETMWDRFDAVVKAFKVPLVMVPGNHDIWDTNSDRIYRRRYGKTYFSFTHKDVHFIILNSETRDKDGQPTERIIGDQLRWLANDLAEHKNAKATFVFLHQPLWQGFHIGEGNGKHWMEDVHPILAKHGVSAVFGGHSHKYVKFPAIDGVPYYVSGGGGAEIGSSESMGDFYHYCLVKVRGNQWQMAVIRPGALEPDTIVESDALILQEIVTISPIEVPANGKQIVIDVLLKNSLPEDVTVTIEPVMEAASAWKIEPDSREALLEAGGQGQTRRFVASIPTNQQTYPGPEFSITFARAEFEPTIIRVRPHIKPSAVSHSPATTKPPVIDGKLDDHVWQNAPVLSKFVTLDASEPAKFATEVRSSYDQENLYLSFRCYEPNLDGMIIDVNKRDGRVYTDDAVEIFFDTNLDRKTYFQVVFNPAAVVYDSLGFDKTWNGLFTAKAGRETKAWTLEVAVPWATLQMKPPKPGKRIGFEVARIRAQSGERTLWAPTYGGNHVPEQFGTLILGK